MAVRQTSVFELMNPRFKINKPIRLIELFAGIGAQAKALELLGANFVSHRVVEWSANSIIAYNAIHKGNWEDHSQGLSVDQLLDKVEGVSLDYNKPADRESLRRRGEAWLRKLYSSMVAINDLVPDVSRVQAADLGIAERERYCYVLTYSFPCQDLSVAGKQKGMDKGSGTRSGLLWEVERILNELAETGALPQVLVMENVPQVYGEKNLGPWNSWLSALRKLGYSNFFQTLNAKDYAIPQNRKRAFMVSVLGDWSYSFPREFSLRHPLKDFLDEDVSESYFLSETMMEGFTISSDKAGEEEGLKKIGQFPGFEANGRVYSAEGLSPTLRTCSGGGIEPKVGGFATIDTYNKKVKINPETAQTIQAKYPVPNHGERVIVAGSLNKYGFDQADRVVSGEGISPTILTAGNQIGHQINILGNYSPSGHSASKVVSPDGIAPTVRENHGTVTAIPTSESPKIKIPCATKKGYMEAEEGDGVIPSWKGARGVVQKKSIPTLLTDDSTVGVVVSKTVCLNPKVDGKQPSLSDRVYSTEGLSTAVTATPFFQGSVADRLWVRKLTEYECGKLMGFDRGDFEKMAEVGLAKSTLYHSAGDSIVVTCLMGIFGEMIGNDYRDKIEARADALATQKETNE